MSSKERGIELKGERERESGEGFLLKPQNSTAHAIPTLRHSVCLYVCREREREREREKERERRDGEREIDR